MTAWLAILVAGGLSYAFRLVPAVLAGRVHALGRLEQVAAYVVPATFAAVAAGGVMARASSGAGSLAPVAPVVAVAVAVVVARRTGSSLAAVAAGLPTLWALTAVTGA